MNRCETCEYCPLANIINFCDDCKDHDECNIGNEYCEKGFEIKCNNGFECK